MAQMYMQQMPTYRPVDTSRNWIEMGRIISGSLQRRRTAREAREVREEKIERQRLFDEEAANYYSLLDAKENQQKALGLLGDDPDRQDELAAMELTDPKFGIQLSQSKYKLNQMDTSQFLELENARLDTVGKNEDIMTAKVDRLSKATQLQRDKMALMVDYTNSFVARNVAGSKKDPLGSYNKFKAMVHKQQPNMTRLIDSYFPNYATEEEVMAGVPKILAANKEHQETLKRANEIAGQKVDLKHGKSTEITTEEGVETRTTRVEEGKVVQETVKGQKPTKQARGSVTIYGPKGETKRVYPKKAKGEYVPPEGWSLTKPETGGGVKADDNQLKIKSRGMKQILVDYGKKGVPLTIIALEAAFSGDDPTAMQAIQTRYEDLKNKANPDSKFPIKVKQKAREDLVLYDRLREDYMTLLKKTTGIKEDELEEEAPPAETAKRQPGESVKDYLERAGGS